MRSAVGGKCRWWARCCCVCRMVRRNWRREECLGIAEKVWELVLPPQVEKLRTSLVRSFLQAQN